MHFLVCIFSYIVLKLCWSYFIWPIFHVLRAVENCLVLFLWYFSSCHFSVVSLYRTPSYWGRISLNDTLIFLFVLYGIFEFLFCILDSHFIILLKYFKIHIPHFSCPEAHFCFLIFLVVCHTTCFINRESLLVFLKVVIIFFKIFFSILCLFPLYAICL